jgi:hypothetical protein
MNKKIYYSTLLFFLIVNSITLIAQTVRCGTYVDAAQIAKDAVPVPDGDPTESLPQINRALSVTVFVVKNQAGIAGVDSASIYNAISTLNLYFSPIALTFRICSAIRYVDNYNFDRLSHEASNEPLTSKDLVTLNFVKNTINLYLVSSLRDQNFIEVDGYTYMPGSVGKDYIFLRKDAIGSSNLAHQVGHYFNLYHTHETALYGGVVERVTRGAGANCSNAGDRCCDTEADPNLGTQPVSGCVYGGTARDGNNDLYSPSPKNIMSFAPDVCRCAFSRTQLLRVKDALERYRANLR